MTDKLTLTQALKDCGFTHQKSKTSQMKRDVIDSRGSVVYTGDAGEVWEWLKEIEDNAEHDIDALDAWGWPSDE